MTNEELRTALNKELKQQQQKRKEETDAYWKRLEQYFYEFSERIEGSDRAYLEKVRQEEEQRREAFQKEREKVLRKNLIDAQKIKAPFLRNARIKSLLKTEKNSVIFDRRTFCCSSKRMTDTRRLFFWKYLKK